MNFLEINYSWASVHVTQGFNYQYPTPVSAYMKEHYCRPAVYRWMVWRPTVGVDAYYIGETEDMVRRVQQCVSPGKRQATNLRLKRYFDDALTRNQQVELQTMKFEPFQINKLTFSMDLLGRTHIRMMLESLVLVLLHSDASPGPPLILNRVFTRDIQRSKKRQDSALAQLKKLGLTDEQTRQVLQAVKITKTST